MMSICSELATADIDPRLIAIRPITFWWFSISGDRSWSADGMSQNPPPPYSGAAFLKNVKKPLVFKAFLYMVMSQVTFRCQSVATITRSLWSMLIVAEKALKLLPYVLWLFDVFRSSELGRESWYSPLLQDPPPHTRERHFWKFIFERKFHGECIPDIIDSASVPEAWSCKMTSLAKTFDLYAYV